MHVAKNSAPGSRYETNLIDPVRVEDTQASNLASNALLSYTAQVAGWLQLGDTLAGRLAIDDTLSKTYNKDR